MNIETQFGSKCYQNNHFLELGDFDKCVFNVSWNNTGCVSRERSSWLFMLRREYFIFYIQDRRCCFLESGCIEGFILRERSCKWNDTCSSFTRQEFLRNIQKTIWKMYSFSTFLKTSVWDLKFRSVLSEGFHNHADYIAWPCNSNHILSRYKTLLWCKNDGEFGVGRYHHKISISAVEFLHLQREYFFFEQA